MKSIAFALLALTGSFAFAMWGGISAAAARSQRTHALQALDATNAQSHEFLRLASLPASAALAAPTGDASAMVTAAIQQSGLGVSLLRDVVAEGDAPAGPDHSRRTFRITLDPIEPAQLGSFLKAWSASQPLWTVARIDLTRVASPIDRSTAYRASLSMACVFVKDARQ